MNIKRGEEIELSIDGFAFGGKGISKINASDHPYVIFTQNAIAGQKVKVKIVKKIGLPGFIPNAIPGFSIKTNLR